MHLNEAIKLDNDIMQNWILLALLERKMGRQDNCMQICEKILSMDPNNERAYEALNVTRGQFVRERLCINKLMS